MQVQRHLPLREAVARLNHAGKRCTLLGVGPVSQTVVRTAFQASVRFNCPPVFIASRNQVDLAELGHGYLMGGMDQAGFVALLRREADAAGYDGPLYICRDHGSEAPAAGRATPSRLIRAQRAWPAWATGGSRCGAGQPSP